MDLSKVSGGFFTCMLIISFARILYLVEGNLRCFDCKVGLKKNSDSSPGCIYDVNNTYTPRECQSHERYCKVERVRLNRVIRNYERNCAEECVGLCQTRGFGVDEETCTFCCDTDGCNHFINSARAAAWSSGCSAAAVIMALKFAHSV